MMSTRSYNNHHEAHEALMFSRLNLYKNAAEDEEFFLQQQHHAAATAPQFHPRERRGVPSAAMMMQQQQQIQQQIQHLQKQQQLLQLQQLQQQQQAQRCYAAANASAHAHAPAVGNNKHLKVKQVLPCFNLICTGTCAYGPKCTFLHDPRAQLPKHVRKQAEFILQSHLHTYRPNLNKVKQQSSLLQSSLLGGHKDEDDDCLSASDCQTDSECSSNNGDHQQPRSTSPSCVWEQQQPAGMKSALTFKKDDIFSFPTMELTYQEPNSKCYDPTEEQIPSYSREMTMWYHFLGTVNEKYGSNSGLVDVTQYGSKRLPVFESIGYGM